LSTCNRPLVWDADALNIFAAEKALLKKLKKESVLTPHPKEFDRLFGAHKTEEQRRKKAVEMAGKYNIIIVLKGPITRVCYQGETFLNTTGNSGLAKGGSGDALTGMITAFLAQGYAPITATKIAVYLHGLAADLTLADQSKESMLISDVIENLGAAFKKVMK
ncbi:MAG TPA: NAD(P)H-hydrate dehydratase, partial [Bacteroidia bacterium]|nr:NAD(P)H-hydrate dehydratase [Bacteroidia bacterium]